MKKLSDWIKRIGDEIRTEQTRANYISFKKIVNKFIKVKDLYNWKRKKFIVKSLPNVEKTRMIINKISDNLGIVMESNRWNLILNNHC